jgi:outer membrane protein assembly factor BamB
MTKTARRLAPAVAGALLLILWNVWGGSDAAADSLLVGNFNSSQSSVLQYDATTGAFGGAFVPANPAVNGGLDFPLGGAFGLDGNFYVSNSDKDSVLRYNGTTGAFLNTFVSADDAAGLAFRSGNLYVAISQPTGAVERFNGTTGASLNPFVTAGSGGLSNPEGFAIGRDGNLYVGSNDDGKVRRYNGTTGAFIDIFATGATSARGVAFGPDGNLYVTNFGGGDVLRFNGITGAFIDKFVTDDTTKNGGLGSLPRPLVFGPDGNLYVGDYGNGSVLRYNGTTGAFIDAFAASGSGGLVGPTFLVFSEQNATPVPEPGTLVLLGSGLTGLLAGFAWKRGGQGTSRRE